MICPHCNADIPDALVTHHAAKINGRKSRRTLTPEAARAMQTASVRARQKKNAEK